MKSLFVFGIWFFVFLVSVLFVFVGWNFGLAPTLHVQDLTFVRACFVTLLAFGLFKTNISVKSNNTN